MSLIKNEIPLLEYDAEQHAVLMPDHEKRNVLLPSKAVMAFLGDTVDQYAAAHDATFEMKFDSVTKQYPAYVLTHQGTDICLVQAPEGASAAVQVMDWIISYGVRKIIACGSCGTLEDFDENVFLIPVRALRDEGTSYHYVKPSRYIDINPVARKAISSALRSRDMDYAEVTTWSTDGIYRETKDKVAYRRAEGCAVVEMECSALAACAKMRGIVFGQLLYTADTLANTEQHDARNWGRDSVEAALAICLDAVGRIEAG